ncbi:MAG: sigma-54 dependent transcriptional regulator [Fibrobacter sp.]|nr:sigma-54 dependent transcriptional regulator [Fibrobacter sp.]
MKIPNVLIVEDDEPTILGFSSYLEKKGYTIKTALTIKDARQLIATENFNAILLDLNLPDGSSLNFIKHILSTEQGVAIIVISGISDVSTAVRAMKYGAANYLTKPIDLENLDLVLKNSLKIEELRKKESIHKRLTKRETPYFGISQKIGKILKYIKVGARNDSVVLLLGETGTGKGVLARWIHEHSDRKNGSFVELNCSSLKGELLRSELYGHTKGAFTSAIKDREGLIELADGGTLFLDEIGDMDIEVQAELLKTIEEKSFRRIGENRVRYSNFRLICATNRNLAKAALDNSFRSDLYYRICVFPIEIPSLRERTEDIPGLIKQLLTSNDYDQFPLDQELVSGLCKYMWPGNIRELRNMIERALLLAQGKPLSLSHFPGLENVNYSSRKAPKKHWNLAAFEKNHIVRAIEYFKDDKLETSKALGISLSSLYRKLENINNDLCA